MRLLLTSLLVLLVSILPAQTAKEYQAIRATSKPKIDGYLTDACWKEATIATDFVQYDPYNGAAPSQPTEVRFLYNNEGLYIGAMMYDSAPDSILRELGLRDERGLNADYFKLTILPYNDGINAVTFSITASGVQSDAVVNDDDADNAWNGLWRVKTRITDQGWSAELFIPYTDIRFPDTEQQIWGLNFTREIRRKRELSTWNYINKELDGIVKQSGTVVGIHDVKPPLRLAFIPYLSGYLNQPEESTTWSPDFNYGLDLKWGINESFTLDVTLIPDFGQVKSDDEIYNLTPHEVQYNENRQFFVEGVDLFNRGEIFYSRRIGKRPVDYSEIYDEIDTTETIIGNQNTTPLFNAIKFSGRTNNGLGIGILNATTQPTNAIVKNTITGETFEMMTQDWANYNMVVLDQSLNNNSYVSLYNTNVNYFGFYRMANVTGSEFSIFNKANSYNVIGKCNLSQLYYSDSTSIGYELFAAFSKTAGQFQYITGYHSKSKTYNANDMGYTRANNYGNLFGEIEYNIYKPFWKLLHMYNSLEIEYERSVQPSQFLSLDFEVSSRIKTRKQLTVFAQIEVSPIESNDPYEARSEGVLYKRPADLSINMFVSPDYTKRIAVDGSADWWTSLQSSSQQNYTLKLEPRIRINNSCMLVLGGEFSKQYNDRGYIEQVENSIVFGERDLRNMEVSAEIGYIFTPQLGLNLRARHYWLSADYDDYFTINDKGYLDPMAINSYNQNNDFNFNNFILDMSFKWEFAPASELSLVWKNSFEKYENKLVRNYIENINAFENLPFANTLSLKVLYYLDYSSIKKSKG